MTRPVIIGLTGGIASGKSTVASMFLRLGAVLLDADKIGHQVLDEEVVKSQIRTHWGVDVFCDDGTIDRKAIASIVFDPEDRGVQLEILESITHPRIGARIANQIGESQAQKAEAIVLDAPLLFEAGWDRFCSHLVFVKTAEQIRLRRVLERGWTQDQFENREQQQLSLKEKEDRSDFTIENSGSTETAFHQVEKIWQKLELSTRPTKKQ